MDATAVILEAPGQLQLRSLALNPVTATDIVVDIAWAGISAGTEKLLWTGRMPAFPGMGYPLVPGYESVGRVVDAGDEARGRIGEWVFVPGSNGFVGARGLFGGTASRVVLPSARALAIDETTGRDGVLVALAATAHHAVLGGAAPQLVIGNGVLGRLVSRITRALGHDAPTIWETNAARRDGAAVLDPADDPRSDYRVILDASGANDAIDLALLRLARGGEMVLAGFYDRVSFAFPPAFLREARFRVAAEFTPADLAAVVALIAEGKLRLDGLVSHERPAVEAETAYPAAFDDPDCLKMVLDWRSL